MASLTDSVGKLIHGAATALIDNEVPSKISTAIATVAEAGFGAVNDALKVVQEMTAPADTAKPADTIDGDK